jgi:cell division septum initiation protein DivIVA
MSADQLNYVSNNEEVLKTKSEMMTAFNLYLFERFKEEFASNDMFTNYCDDYVDKVLDVASNYSESIKQTLDENEKLKAKILKLEKELNNAKSNTKGT